MPISSQIPKGDQHTRNNRYSHSGDEDLNEYDSELMYVDGYQSLDDSNYEMNNRFGSSDYDFDEDEDYNGRHYFELNFRDGHAQAKGFGLGI